MIAAPSSRLSRIVRLACVLASLATGCGGASERPVSALPQQPEIPAADDGDAPAASDEGAATGQDALWSMADSSWTLHPLLVGLPYPFRVGVTFQPCSARLLTGDGRELARIDLGYDANGRLVEWGWPTDRSEEMRSVRESFCFAPDLPTTDHRTYEYDGQGRLAGETDDYEGRPMGHAVYAYDARSTLSPGDETEYFLIIQDWDEQTGLVEGGLHVRAEHGRFANEQYWLRSGEALGPTRNTYDEQGRLSKQESYAEFDDTTTDRLYAYDAEDRLITLTFVDRSLDLPAPIERVHRFEYEDGRIARCTIDGEDTRVDFERTPDGRLAARTLRRTGEVVARWEYDYGCASRPE